MKVQLIIGLVFYTIGLVSIVDWFIFWELNYEEAIKNRPLFLEKYIGRFPDYIKPLFTSTPEPATIISIVLFSVAGFIFLKRKIVMFKVLAISSFLFALWNLFTMM